MASTSQTGYANNVAAFDDLISVVRGFGSAYNPSRENLSLASLQAISQKSRESMNSVNALLPAYRIAVSARETSFLPMSRLVTRLINSLKASGASVRIVESANTFVRKLQGRRAKAKSSEAEKLAGAAEGNNGVEISASQMGYDTRMDNFDKLIKLLAGVEQYAPNEADLQVASLTALYEELKLKNMAVIEAATPLENARILRNEVFFKPETGMVDIALVAKAYVKSVFGTSSPQYKQVAGLKFRKN